MKRTVLHEVHSALHARLVDFAGYEMPIQYRSGINGEHNAVRNGVGVFDVSHMGQIRVRSNEATRFLQFAALNDAGRLRVGRAQYSMLANDKGGLIDDIYVYRDADEDYMIVSNASNRAEVFSHLSSLARGRDVEVIDETDDWALLAVQGPQAEALLGGLTGDDLSAVRKNQTVSALISGADVRLTRTGYTGEDGFEVFSAPEDAVGIWNAVTGAGAVPCGLGARDTLRLEAGFPLFGNDIGPDTNPLCTPLAWVVKDKDFYGRDALWGADCKRRLAGLRLMERGIPRHGYAVGLNGKTVGEITSGTISPFTRDALALAWIDAELSEVGTELSVEIRGQPVAAVVSELPFLKR